MDYIFGIVGIVLVGSIFCGLLYSLFIKKYNSLDDAYANMREDRRFGSYDDIDEDEEDDEMLDIFENNNILIDDELILESDELQADKFMARRTNNDVVQDMVVEQSVAAPVPVMVNSNINDVEEL